MQKIKKRHFYARPFIAATVVVATLLTLSGLMLRRTLLTDLPQYIDVPDIAIPMMLLQDSGPLREARTRAEWEAAQAEMAEALTPEPAMTAEPAMAAVPAVTLAPAVTVEPVASMEPVATVEPVAAAESAALGDAVPGIEDEPLPQPVEITESYFDHTLFIGDSKTDGLRQWGRLGEAHYFCGTNYSVFNIFDKTASDVAFKKLTLDEVLSTYEYDQIYILLGYNESGYPYSHLIKQFKYVISRVHEAQPQARIILHGIMHASRRVAKRISYYTVKNLEKENDGLRELAASVDGLYYVDCNGAFCDEDGYLLSEVSSDGEHLTSKYTAQWAQEILKRAIVD